MKNTLYRYRPIDEKELDCLKKNELFFASPKDFNDPFDCKNIFSIKDSTDDDWREFLLGEQKYKHPALTENERQKKVELIIKTGVHRDTRNQEDQLRIWKDLQEEEFNKLGIVCLSHTPNDILMWSHYSNNHQGVCLEFDRQILGTMFHCQDVQYCEKYPTFNQFLKELRISEVAAINDLSLFTKSDHWKHEKECRLIAEPEIRTDCPGERKYKYPENALTGIIFGCQTKDTDKEKVKDALKSKEKSIIYYQAEKSKTMYAVDIKEV